MAALIALFFLVPSADATRAWHRPDCANAHLWTLSGVPLSGATNVITAVADPGAAWESNVASTVTLNLNVRGSYAYDADGNVVYINRGSKDYALVWDALGRLASVAVRDGAGNGLNWSATYDALGRRVKTTTSTVVSNAVAATTEAQSVYDPENPMQEVYRTEGTNVYVYLYGSDLSGDVGGLGGIGGLIAFRENETVRQVVSDLRGNVIGTVSTSGAVAFNPRYSAFGPMSAPSLSAPSFSTRRYDPMGFYHFGARPYDPVTGRMLSRDPARFADSRNLHAYAGNQPITGLDPDGRLSTSKGNTFSFYGSCSTAGGATYQAAQDFGGRGLNAAAPVGGFQGG